MALVCVFENLIQADIECVKSIGGIRASYGINWKDVESVAYSAGKITGIVLKSGKKLAKLVYDDDNTATYTQEGQRNGNDFRVNQTATLKFTGASGDKVVIANKAKGVLNGLWLHLANDGTVHVQGAEINGSGDGVVKSTQGAKVNPNVNTNTSEGASDVTYNIVSLATDFLVCSNTIDEDYLDALADIGS